jgi:endoglucanase
MQNTRIIAIVAACAVTAFAGCGGSGDNANVGVHGGTSNPESFTVGNLPTQFDPLHRQVQAVPGGGDPTDPNAGAAAASDVGAAAVAPPPPPPVPFRGVNLSGAEGDKTYPGVEHTNYELPTPAEVDYFMAKGMNTFRVEMQWERMQHAAMGDFDPTYASRLDALVAYATSKGAHVIINPQNFARYWGNVIGSPQVPNAVFSDFWSKMAARYGASPNVVFNLVNEPHDMPTEQWVSAANAAIAAIRATGATNTILVPGNGWTAGGTWNGGSYGTPNATAMLNIADPLNNLWFEAHVYLDDTQAGTSPTCVSPTIGQERLTGFIDWLRANGKKGFIGEFAGADNPTCNAAVAGMMAYAMAQTDVLEGWAWWAAGPWWHEYMFTLEPTPAGADRPQLALLAPYLPAP